MPDSLTLLRLTAELHAAARAPEKWPAAWAALCHCFDCPDVFENGNGAATEESVLLDGITARSAAARRCAEAATGRCGHGAEVDENKRQSCLALVDHLDHALAVSMPEHVATLPDAYLAALDELPIAMLLCRADRRLVYANRAGKTELEYARWLRRDGAILCGVGSYLPMQLIGAFARLGVAQAGADDCQLPPAQIEGNAADIGLRRLADGGGESLILVSLVTHAAAPTQEHLTRLGQRWQLRPRQEELAGLLLAGHSLDRAAGEMGITRRTARDHLDGLFRATGTRRQQDLIARLTRDLSY